MEGEVDEAEIMTAGIKLRQAREMLEDLAKELGHLLHVVIQGVEAGIGKDKVLEILRKADDVLDSMGLS